MRLCSNVYQRRFKETLQGSRPRIKEHLKKFEEWRKIALKKKSIFPVQKETFVGIHPPLSAACAIMSPTTVYTLIGTKPDIIKILFDKMLKAYFKLMDYREKLTGEKIESIGLANDNSAFISNKMYVEQVLSLRGEEND